MLFRSVKFTPGGAGSVVADTGLYRPTYLAFDPSGAPPGPIPEPATCAVGLLCLGVGLAGRRLRRA